MKNYIKPGHTLDLTAPAGGLSSGDGYLFGSLFGVAATAAEEGAKVAVSLEGVFLLPKVSGAAITEGAKAYWTGTAVTATASGNTLIGHAAAAASADATVAEIRISN